MAPSAKNGWLSLNVPFAGPTLLAAPGLRSIGGAGALMPNAVMPCARRSPSVRPMRAKVVLHDTVKLSARVPPQVSPLKFDSARFDCGSGILETRGKGVAGLTMPASSPTAAVSTLNVDPAGEPSRYPRGRSGWGWNFSSASKYFCTGDGL